MLVPLCTNGRDDIEKNDFNLNIYKYVSAPDDE